MKNKNIRKIRKKLDNLDIKLLKIIKLRSNLVDQIIKNKITINGIKVLIFIFLTK